MPISRRRITAALTAAVLAALPTAAPASPKPCRDTHGRIIPCAKPKSAPSPVSRPRDGAGRFARPGAAPHPG